MKLLKLSLVAAGAALVIGTGTLARANDVADGTYVFHATDGNIALDNSSVTFKSDGIVSWNLVDDSTSQYAWLPLGYGYPALFPPLTPDNSSIIGQATYANGTGPDAFSFSIGSPSGGVASTNESIFWFEGQNNLNNQSALWDGATFNPVPGDPIGVWTLASVPDASGTFVLLVVALTALGTCKSFLRRPAASRC
jgi:hypothetical protein